MADFGFVFKASTDETGFSAGDSAVNGELAPHVYTNGRTGGWSAAVSTFEITGSGDYRLRAINYVLSGPYFESDMPASGDKVIQAAIGRGGDGFTHKLALNDGSSYSAQVSLAAGSVMDAGGNNRTYADWPSAQATVTKNWSGTTFRITPSSPGDSDYGRISYVGITASGGAPAAPKRLPMIGIGLMVLASPEKISRREMLKRAGLMAAASRLVH